MWVTLQSGLSGEQMDPLSARAHPSRTRSCTNPQSGSSHFHSSRLLTCGLSGCHLQPLHVDRIKNLWHKLLSLCKGENLIGRKCGTLFCLVSVEHLVCVTEIICKSKSRKAFSPPSLEDSALGNKNILQSKCKWITGQAYRTLAPKPRYKL